MAARYVVYMLRCEGDSLYTGITTEVGRRLREHLSGKAPGARYTRTHRPLELVALWSCGDRASALRLEYRIKRLTRAQKNELLAEPSRAGVLGSGREDDVYHVLWPSEKAPDATEDEPREHA